MIDSHEEAGSKNSNQKLNSIENMILNYDPNQFPSEDKVRTMVYAIT
jgi:hypothetical protein